MTTERRRTAVATGANARGTGRRGLAHRESGIRGRPTIVLLHGVGSTGSMWSDLMSSLSGYHCLAPDLPGHGASRSLPWRSRAATAQLVAELIESRATGGRSHLVGLSLGGSVALELLATRSELLDHVVVDGCAALPSRLGPLMKVGVAAVSPLLRFRSVARAIGRAFGVQPGHALDDFVRQMRSVDARSFRRAFADANDVRVTAALLSAPSPTLLVAGERELSNVRESNRVLAAGMPHAQARMVPGANHGWGPAQQPDLHRRMIEAWIADREVPAGVAQEAPTVAAALYV